MTVVGIRALLKRMENKLPTPHLQKEVNKLLEQIQLLQEQMIATPESQEPPKPKKTRDHGHTRLQWDEVEAFARLLLLQQITNHDLPEVWLAAEVPNQIMDIKPQSKQLIEVELPVFMDRIERVYNQCAPTIGCRKENVEKISLLYAMIICHCMLKPMMTTACIANNMRHMGVLGDESSSYLLGCDIPELLASDQPDKPNKKRKAALNWIKERMVELQTSGILERMEDKYPPAIGNPWAQFQKKCTTWTLSSQSSQNQFPLF